MVTSRNAPLYQQIYEDVKDSIKNGTYKPDEKIPSEADLSEEYGVSRITVRRAIEDLCSDGYLIKMQGRGTFVCKPHIMRRLSQSRATRSFTEVCEDAGVLPGAHLVDCQIVPARVHELEFFGLDEGSLLVHVHRIRTADGKGVCDENIVIPYTDASDLLTTSLEDASLFDAIERVTGHRPVSTSEWVITAVKATTDQASSLGISTGDPLLRTTVSFVDAESVPVCMGRHFFVGNRYELAI